MDLDAVCDGEWGRSRGMGELDGGPLAPRERGSGILFPTALGA